MSNEASGAPATAAPSAPELQPSQGATVDGGVVDTPAQPAEPSAPASGEGAAPAQPQQPDPRSPNGRISHYSRLAQQEREGRLRAEGEAEALRKLVAAGQQPQPAPAPAETQAPAGPVEPDPSDRAKYPLGDIDPQYFRDMVDYAADLKVAKAFETRDQQAKEAEASAALTTRVEVAAQASIEAGYDAGAEFLRTAPMDVPEVREVVEDVLSTKNAGLVAAYFGTHVDQFKQIAALPTRQRLQAIYLVDAEMGKRVASAPSTAQPAPSAQNGQPAPTQPAHAPTPVITGGGGAAPIGPPPEGDMNAYRAWREKAFG